MSFERGATMVAAALVSLVGVSQGFAQGSKNPACVHEYVCKGGTCTLRLEFEAATACRVRIDDGFVRRNTAERVTEATDLRVRVDRANHLRYALKVDTKEVVVESYVHLERLWSQVLGPLGAGRPAVALSEQEEEDAFVKAILAWRAALAQIDSDLSTFVGKFPALNLTEPQSKNIGNEGNKVGGWIERIAKLQGVASDKIIRSENFAVFDGTNVLHEALVARLRSFEILAGYCANGFTRKVAFGPAGRIVTATITATDRASSKVDDASLVVEFLVHSKLPLTFHAGFAYRDSSEVRFEPVTAAATTAGGADLFTRINGAKDTTALTAFMSYRLPLAWCDVANAGKVAAAICPQATLGTDFANVGERFYFGASWRLGRVFVTVGRLSVEETDGIGSVNDVLGGIGNVTESRELFTSLSKVRRTKGYVAISFAPF